MNKRLKKLESCLNSGISWHDRDRRYIINKIKQYESIIREYVDLTGPHGQFAGDLAIAALDEEDDVYNIND